jgi:hypothetical protein
MKILAELSAHKELALILTLSSLLAVPWLIARAPRDFFTRDDKAYKKQISLPLKVLKNLAGLVLIGMGVAMLLLPGQGILTLVVGLALVDGPGKHALLVRIAQRASVMRALNYFRRRAQREPFDAPG